MREVERVETRSTRLKIRADVPGIDAEAVGPATPVGLRIGSVSVETTLGSDPRWRQDRTRARVVLPAAGADVTPGWLELSWKRGKLRARGRLPGRTPHADVRASAPPGPVQDAFDAAFRIGGESLRFAGTLTGTVRGRDVTVLGAPVHVARVRLAGTGRIVPVTEDGSAPSVAIVAPANGRLVPPGAVTVEGTLRDDRTIVRMTVALDDGPEIDAPFVLDPATGHLDDLVATFAVPVEVAEGTHAVTVRAYDDGGNVGVSAEGFFAGAAPTDAFDAGDAQGSAYPSYAAVDGSGQVRRSLSPGVPVAGLRGTIAVATSPAGLFALQPDGSVLALGDNALGFLGNGTTDPSSTPVTVSGLTGVTAVAAGGAFGVALRADGTVWTWGDGRSGALGGGTLTSVPRTVPAPVEGLPAVRSIGTWSHGAIAVDVDGSVWTWGSSEFAGTFATPVRVEGPADVVSASSGYQGHHFLAVDASGQVWSWGGNGYGELGRGLGASPYPERVPGIANAKSVACGRDHSLVLLADGTVLSFGRGLYGTLGNGPEQQRSTPSVVTGLDQVVDLDAGFNASFALRADGTVWAWGFVNNASVPTQVAGF